MTLWGEPEWVHVQNKWSSCMHMTVIRMWLTLQATEWHSKSTNTCTTQEQWSSPAGTSHTVYMDVLHTGSTSCALQDTWDMMQLTPIWHGQMKHFRRIFQHALAPLLSEFQHRNCESGNNTRNSAIEEVGCSGSMSSLLVNHFWICSIRAASDLQHDVRYMQTDRQTIRPATPLGGGLLWLTPIIAHPYCQLNGWLGHKLYVEPVKRQGRDGPFVLNWPVGSSHDVLCLFSAVPKAMQLPPNPQFTRRDSES